MYLADTVYFSHTAREVICLTNTAGITWMADQSFPFSAPTKSTSLLWMTLLITDISEVKVARSTEGSINSSLPTLWCRTPVTGMSFWLSRPGIVLHTDIQST